MHECTHARTATTITIAHTHTHTSNDLLTVTHDTPPLAVRYYIEKCLNPALDRMLALCGVSVQQWYHGVRHPVRRMRHVNYAEYEAPPPANGGGGGGGRGHNGFGGRGGGVRPHALKQTSLDPFLHSGSCEVCGRHPFLTLTLTFSHLPSPPSLPHIPPLPSLPLPQVCGKHPTERSLCPTCQADPADSLATLTSRLTGYQRAEEQVTD